MKFQNNTKQNDTKERVKEEKAKEFFKAKETTRLKSRVALHLIRASCTNAISIYP